MSTPSSSDARRTFWPRLPRVRGSSASETVTSNPPFSRSLRDPPPSDSSSTVLMSSTSAGRSALRANLSILWSQRTTSTRSPRSSRLTARMREPPGPRQAATGSTPGTALDTATLARMPGWRATARTWTTPRRTSGVSRSMRPASTAGAIRDRMTGGSSGSMECTATRMVSSGLKTSCRLCSSAGSRPSTGPRLTMRSCPSRRATIAVSSLPTRSRNRSARESIRAAPRRASSTAPAARAALRAAVPKGTSTSTRSPGENSSGAASTPTSVSGSCTSLATRFTA